MKRTIAAALTAVAITLASPAFATDYVLTANPGNPNANPLGANFVYFTGLSSSTHVEAALHGDSTGTSPDSFFFSVQQFNFIGAGSGTSNTQSHLTFSGPIELYAYALNGADLTNVNNLLNTNFTTTTNTAAGIRSFVSGTGAPTLLAFGDSDPLQQLFSNVPLNLGFLYEIRVPHTGTGSYSGTLTADAVPEPATWAMMLAGFGLIGFAMRRQRQSHPKVRFAF